MAFHGIVESIRLEKPSKIHKPKCQPSTTEPRPRCHRHTFLEHSQGGCLPGQPVPVLSHEFVSGFPCLHGKHLLLLHSTDPELSSLSSSLGLSHLLLPTFPGLPCLWESSGFQVYKELEPGSCQQVLAMLPHTLLRKGLEHPFVWDYCP